jgi:hypothetical protein
MNYPNPRIDRERYISSLRESDETVEELLSSGADIDDLIEAGIIDDELDSELKPESPPEAIAPLPLDVDSENF